MIIHLIAAFLMSAAQPHSPAGQPPCGELKIINHPVGWGHKKVGGKRRIEAIIIHSSYNALSSDSFSVTGILREYEGIDVSPHYIIDRDGDIYRLVADRDIAYQAGKSRLPDGRTDVNRVSIGIEIVNTTHDSPTELQYLALARLVECLESKYDIRYVLGHSDIAPGRKTDPWNFNWNRFRGMIDTNDKKVRK